MADDEPSPSCLSCLFGSKKKNKNDDKGPANSNPAQPATGEQKDNGESAQDGKSGGRRDDPRWTGKRGSVYFSARNQLNEEDLEALRQFEEAVHATGSVYFDAPEMEALDELTYAPAKTPNAHPRASILMENPDTLRMALQEPRVKLSLAGYPGELTEEEVEQVKEFRDQLKQRKQAGGDGHVYEEMVRAFRPTEEEPYALCRFLRARAFNVEEVFSMIDEAIPDWQKAAKCDFFPGKFHQ